LPVEVMEMLQKFTKK